MRAAATAWAELIAARWRGLIEQFTGGDPGTHASLERMYREEEPRPLPGDRCRPS